MSSSSYFPGRSRLEPEINASTKILRVSSVMTPNLFWATELPLQSMHFENTPMGKVLKLEFELRGLYTQDPSKTPIKLIPAGALDPKSLRPGKMVAVRRHHADPHWYRGRVLSVFQSGPNAPDVARIFLLDYGEYLEDVNLRMNVRKLPIKMTLHPKPLAVPLVLAGLRPVSLDMDYEVGMKTLSAVVADTWSETALALMKNYLDSSPHRLVRVRDWAHDKLGRLHADRVVLLAGKINLKEVLLKNKFAVYDQATFFADLLESPSDEDCFPSYMMKTLSICGNGPPVDTSLSTAGGERQHSSNLDITTDSAHFRSRINFGLDETLNNSVILPDEKGSGKGGFVHTPDHLRVGGKWISVPPKRKTKPLPKQEKSDRDLKRERMLQKIWKKPATDIWSSVRETLAESTPADPDGKDSEFSYSSSTVTVASKTGLIPPKPMMIPGGVDPGKFLEEQLRRTVSEGIGPKKIDPSNLIKGDLPPKPAAPYRGDHDKSYRRIQGFGAANVSVADSYLDDEGW